MKSSCPMRKQCNAGVSREGTRWSLGCGPGSSLRRGHRALSTGQGVTIEEDHQRAGGQVQVVQRRAPQMR